MKAKRNAINEVGGPQTESADKIRHLFRLRGIDHEIASGLVDEVYYRGFENRRQIAGSPGLSPGPFSSGGTVREQGINKAGRPTAAGSDSPWRVTPISRGTNAGACESMMNRYRYSKVSRTSFSRPAEPGPDRRISRSPGAAARPWRS